MTFIDATLAWGREIPGWRDRVLEAWDSLSVRLQCALKVSLVVGSSVAAFHYSLASLLQTLGYDTPLAYVGLVPVFATVLAFIHRVPRVAEPPVHDRQTDYILGVPLLAGSLIATFALPAHLGLMYWFNRVDLLLLPVFVLGSTILVFGSRVAWRQRLSIGYLALAWPWPYTHILLGTLNGFTSVTLTGLRLALKIVPVATPAPGGQGIFQVMHHGAAFPVSVVTACSGVDGMVGFFLVGAGFAGTVSGGRWRKTIWLLLGLVLLWTTNLLRLLFIFWVGSIAGENVALNVLHPVAGLVVFSIGIVLMLLLLRPLGLRLVDARAAAAIKREVGTVQPGTNRVFFVAAMVAVVAVIMAANNSALRAYDLVSSASGEPRLGSFLAQPAAPTGWNVTWATEYESNKPLFGQSSRWWRYIYSAPNPHAPLYSSYPVTADVIDAAGLSGFGQYGVEACYTFHGYVLRDVAKVSLGDGINGQALSYSGARADEDWSIVYWIWPVATATGTRYERIILYLQNTPGEMSHEPGSVTGVSGLKGALSPANSQQARLIDNRAFLVAFGRAIVQGQSAEKDVGVNIALAVPPPTPFAGALQPKKTSLWERLHAKAPKSAPSARTTASAGQAG